MDPVLCPTEHLLVRTYLMLSGGGQHRYEPYPVSVIVMSKTYSGLEKCASF